MDCVGFFVISIHTSPKGGDRVDTAAIRQTNISIHTSPKGGDEVAAHGDLQVLISIHTSPKGGDATRLSRPMAPTYFNPHLPEGR